MRIANEMNIEVQSSEVYGVSFKTSVGHCSNQKNQVMLYCVIIHSMHGQVQYVPKTQASYSHFGDVNTYIRSVGA